MNTFTNLPSNKKFGWFFFSIFFALGLLFVLKGFVSAGIISIIFSLFFFIAVKFSPKLLTPLNHFWYMLGIVLGKLMTPVILGIIFFLLLTPVSLITRLFGRDELRIKKSSLQTYWIDRLPPGPPGDTFNNQF